MKKVLWHSVAPWAPTGYGVQTSLFAPRIAALDDIDLAISAGFGLEGAGMPWGDIHIYPTLGGNSVGERWSLGVHQWAKLHGQGEPVTVITLMDVWPLNQQIFKAVADQGVLACWAPVDHCPVENRTVEFFQATGARPIAMSRFGEQEFKNAGLDPLYVPHGVNTNVFKPHPRDEVREKLGFAKDSFVVGMVANNQGQSPARKGFSEAFLAFSMFRENHPEAILYLHTEVSGFRGGLDLMRLAERFEIPAEAVICTNQVQMDNGVPAAIVAQLYCGFDVLLNPSYGEGFGVPIIEAQACGTPVIVSDWTSMPELCGAGWKVGGVPWDHAMAESFWLKPDVDEIVNALEQAYGNRDNEQLRHQARAFALGYDADSVMEHYWKPVLEELGKPREVQPLKPNRAMRRAAKAAA